jgi:hypothetical protein
VSDRRNRGAISRPVSKLLAQLRLHGFAELHATKWVVPQTGDGFQHKTIEAAYERYLVKIIYESKYKRKQIVELTEIGELAALGVIERAVNMGNPHQISEAAALMIQEIIA